MPRYEKQLYHQLHAIADAADVNIGGTYVHESLKMHSRNGQTARNAAHAGNMVERHIRHYTHPSD